MPTLPDILREHHVTFRRHGEDHHVSSGWLGTACPWCGGHSFHFGFHLTSGRTNCWRCGPRSRVVAVAKLCRIDVQMAARLLGTTPTRREDRLRRPGRLLLPAGVGPLLTAHRTYLSGRGLNPDEVVRLWKIGGLGIVSGGMSWRIFVPIRDRLGRTVSWTTRALVDYGQRWLSAKAHEEDVPQAEILYGSDLARSAAIIVEGPTDVWSIGPGAVGTLGTSITKPQIRQMAEFPRRVVCFDSSSDAQQRASELCRTLSLFPGETENVLLETGEDPAAASPGEIADLRAQYLG